MAENAHVVIVNHALLLADVAVENKALPEYKYLVIDEAHHLEAAATDALGFVIDRDEVGRNLGDLARGGRKVAGLLSDIVTQARSALPPDQSGAIEVLSDRAAASTQRASQASTIFFDEMQSFVANQNAADGSDYAQRTRLTTGVRSNPGWGAVERAFDPLLDELTAVAKSVNGLHAAPLHVGEMIRQRLWDQKESVVLTSATMRTASASGKALPTFDYVKGRLEANDAGALALGSPFDYKNSTLVYVVSDMPEPNQQGYQQMVERGLVELFRASQGRGMALFTSYAQLRATSKVIAPLLLRDGIMVYEQGDGVSRRAMLDQFRGAERAVILGTRSFWEGVDIQGEKLSALAICKLPFDVPTDPIFAARSETFENSFSDYSVPESVLKFRQGFGRLIRSRSDRGVVAVFDRRVISKQYGQAFLNALPGPTIQRGLMAGLGAAVSAWLTSPRV
jgi:DNA polymerase-3 subunit epsilon/ATP-dependent DNA helicase DinG